MDIHLDIFTAFVLVFILGTAFTVTIYCIVWTIEFIGDTAREHKAHHSSEEDS
jgi:hypothetical protein